jgi:YHS domain-containing protein
MKRFAALMVLAGILVLSIPVLAAAPDEKIPCSVCGFLMDKETALSAEYEGVTYYFCEAGCKAYFMKDPAAFAAGMDMDPVCGMTVKKAGSIEVVQNGRQIHFCSEACKDKYLANPAEYELNYDIVSNEVMPQKNMKHTFTFEGIPYRFATAENKAAFEKNPEAYVYAECPVSGKVFLRKDAGATATYEGKTYYFCCKDCLAKFNADPKKYLGPRESAVEGCTGEHGKKAGEMKHETKKGAGASAEAGCPATKKAACPMQKECKK